jgi:predicted short-subunit dehydrogenase-like oxidoreductase (DUF2520 family)
MRIVIIGSGNVATHLARAFKHADQLVSQVWSRSLKNAEALAVQVAADAINDFAHLDHTADLYLVAVKDEAIAGIADQLGSLTGVVVHTSGSTSMVVLKSLNRYGVFYPLQTFSKQKALDLSQMPICLEANTVEVMQLLSQTAALITTASFQVDSEQRKILHLAAVFACNFSNHLYQIGYSILEQHGLDFAMLKPLIMETAQKVQDAVPFEVQTGPAIRADETTMAQHLSLLNEQPELQNIYKTLSNSIKKTHL